MKLSLFLRNSFALAAVLLLPAAALRAQSQSQSNTSSSSNPDSTASSQPQQPARDPGFAAGSLDTSEPLFYLAAALNVCGYDTGLDQSLPIRIEIRNDLNQALAATPAAQDSRDALCLYIQQHRLSDSSQNVAQYTRLALYLNQPPALTSTVGELDMQPDAANVIGILPLVRTFADTVHLNAIWASHRAEYDAALAQVSQVLRPMIRDTKIYLRLPLSDNGDRRFVVLLEPMLAPSQPSALLTGADYLVVVSPRAQPLGEIPVHDVRHTYLRYELEPLIYAKADAMDRLLPLLQAVRRAPIDFDFKSNIESLLTECLIRAVEARTLDTGIPVPKRPNSRERADLEHYDAAMSIYNKQAEIKRRELVSLDMRQGWIVTEYFYGALIEMENGGDDIAEEMAPILYGMDYDSVRRRGLQIAFLPPSQDNSLHITRPPVTGLALAQAMLAKGDAAGAEDAAHKVLADPKGDHGGAHEVLGILAVMQRDPDTAIQHFQQALQLSKDLRILAWSHIYLGRLYDIQNPPDRDKAIAEYKAALAVRDGRADTKAQAEAGIAKPFATPQRAQPPPDESDDAPLDPTGKAEKDAYRPPPPAK